MKKLLGYIFGFTAFITLLLAMVLLSANDLTAYGYKVCTYLFITCLVSIGLGVLLDGRKKNVH